MENRAPVEGSEEARIAGASLGRPTDKNRPRSPEPGAARRTGRSASISASLVSAQRGLHVTDAETSWSPAPADSEIGREQPGNRDRPRSRSSPTSNKPPTPQQPASTQQPANARTPQPGRPPNTQQTSVKQPRPRNAPNGRHRRCGAGDLLGAPARAACHAGRHLRRRTALAALRSPRRAATSRRRPAHGGWRPPRRPRPPRPPAPPTPYDLAGQSARPTRPPPCCATTTPAGWPRSTRASPRCAQHFSSSTRPYRRCMSPTWSTTARIGSPPARPGRAQRRHGRSASAPRPARITWPADDYAGSPHSPRSYPEGGSAAAT